MSLPAGPPEPPPPAATAFFCWKMRGRERKGEGGEGEGGGRKPRIIGVSLSEPYMDGWSVWCWDAMYYDVFVTVMSIIRPPPGDSGASINLLP